MKAATTVCSPATGLLRSRLLDYLELTRPKIALLVLFTVTLGVALASPGAVDFLTLIHVLVGTTLVTAGASALNQFLERHTDGLMQRTENRPLPAGRLHPLEVFTIGLLASLLGLSYLAFSLKHPWAALVAGVTLVSYVGLYTPLKRVTEYNTLIGALPGALPPVIGWSAVAGSTGWTLPSLQKVLVAYSVLLLWQLPHFFAIAWLYREDYGRAKLRMLPVDDPHGVRTGRQMVGFCWALLLVSIAPVFLGLVGYLYLVGALVLGVYFLRACLQFQRACTSEHARHVLRASLLYLPALFACLLIEVFLLAVVPGLKP